jgi:hypothetical protein
LYFLYIKFYFLEEAGGGGGGGGGGEMMMMKKFYFKLWVHICLKERIYSQGLKITLT